MSVVIGLDLSLRASGVCLSDRPPLVVSPIDPRLSGGERIDDLRSQVERLLIEASPVLALIETSAFNRGKWGTPKTLVELAELNGAIKALLAKRMIPLLPVAPSQVKKYAAGDGRADKKQVKQGCIEKWRVPDRGWDDNQFDAFVLARIGEAYLSVKLQQGYRDLDRGQREVLAALLAKELE